MQQPFGLSLNYNENLIQCFEHRSGTEILKQVEVLSSTFSYLHPRMIEKDEQICYVKLALSVMHVCGIFLLPFLMAFQKQL
jgi:hypothetical protein